MSIEVMTSPGAVDNGSTASCTDATEAFDALRLEVLKTQQALEEVRAALTQSRPPDYTSSLALITQAVKQIASELHQLHGHPALRLTPADYQHALTQCSQNALRDVIAQLDATGEASRLTHQAFMTTLGIARTRQQQARWLAIASALALTVGLLLSPLLAHLLPFGLDARIGAVVMASDRWEAGERLMQAGSPEGWAAIERAANLARLNRDAIQVCQLAAAKTQKAQRCEISVPSPE